MTLLDGRALAATIRAEVKAEIEKTEIKPGLGVILVGADPASHLYVSLKEKACAEVDIKFEKHLFFAAEPEEKIIATIRELNARPDIHAILVQLPLPHPLSDDRVIAAIDPRKDADGFHPENLKLLAEGNPRVIPVVHRGILALIDSTGLDLRGKSAVIFANSRIFADPLATLLSTREMRVAVQIPLAHTQPNPYPLTLTPNPSIIVSALGRPHWLKCDSLPSPSHRSEEGPARRVSGALEPERSGGMSVDGRGGEGKGEGSSEAQILIDVGTTRLEDGTLVGDINASTCTDKPGWLTPVPGGVGPMTVAMLLKNTLDLSSRLPKIRKSE